MSETTQNILLVVSSILIIASTVPYLIDIAKKNTKPRVVSWFNWAILGAIAGAAALADGQIPAAVLSFASSVEVLLVVIFGLYYGDRTFEKFDIFCQLGAVLGLVLWLVFNSPLIAIIAVTSIDIIAALPTYKHCWQKPHEETLLTFIICAFAAMLTLLAISDSTLSGLVYPVYILIANVAMASILIFRRKTLRK